MLLYPVINYDNAIKFIETKMPTQMNKDDFGTLINLSKKIIELENKRNKYIYLTSSLNHILLNHPVDRNKPQYIDEIDMNGLINIENDILKARRLNNLKSTRIEINKKKINELKSKLVQQLNIINDILTDPTSITRIEDYNNCFAPGNYINLIKLSKYLNEGNIL